MSKYQVIVGNVGTVLDTDDQLEARRTFDSYERLSKDSAGRVAGESVVFMEDDEPVMEYAGTLGDED